MDIALTAALGTGDIRSISDLSSYAILLPPYYLCELGTPAGEGLPGGGCH